MDRLLHFQWRPREAITISQFMATIHTPQHLIITETQWIYGKWKCKARFVSPHSAAAAAASDGTKSGFIAEVSRTEWSAETTDLRTQRPTIFDSSPSLNASSFFTHSLSQLGSHDSLSQFYHCLRTISPNVFHITRYLSLIGYHLKVRKLLEGAWNCERIKTFYEILKQY